MANLDPAAENCNYNPIFGSLIYFRVFTNDRYQRLNFLGRCDGVAKLWTEWRVSVLYGVSDFDKRSCSNIPRYLLQNSDWLHDELEACGEDEYILLDCPGQVELYSHLPIMHNLVKQIQMWGYQMVSVYLLDALFVLEPSKFISGCMLSLSCMLQLGLPHINVVTKCDLADKSQVLHILESESAVWITNEMNRAASVQYRKLTEAIGSVIDDYMMIGFVMLDITDEDSLTAVIAHADHAVQYGEDVEPMEPKEDDQMEDIYG